MEFVSSTPAKTAADIREVLRQTKLTSAESKAIAAAREALKAAKDAAWAFASPQRADRNNQPCNLTLAVWDRTADFASNPNHETARAVADAIIMQELSPRIEVALDAGLEQLTKRINGELAEVVLGYFDRASEALNKSLAEAQAVLDGNPSLTAEATAFRRKVEATTATTAKLRAQAATDPLQFLAWEIGI